MNKKELQSELDRMQVKFDELLIRIKRMEERLDSIYRPPQPVPSPFPFTPYAPPTTPWDRPATPWDSARHCPKCGIKLEGVMGYACPQPGCPTGLGGPTC